MSSKRVTHFRSRYVTAIRQERATCGGREANAPNHCAVKSLEYFETFECLSREVDIGQTCRSNTLRLTIELVIN